jgi:6-phosphogluconolactonase
MIALHIEGSAKRDVFETAISPGSSMPVRAVIDDIRTPAQVFWAP